MLKCSSCGSEEIGGGQEEPLHHATAKEWARVTHALTTSTHPLTPKYKSKNSLSRKTTGIKP
jgi:hypothetical protein